MKRIPILIDCDPGVDDSFAIALANAHPAFEVTALTAVVGNVPAAVTRRNCLGLRELFDMEQCKVAFGAELPLVKPYFREVSVTHGEGGVGGIHFPDCRRKEDTRAAWDVIYDEAVKHHGELVLFAIGPLTNIAFALRKYPDLPKHLKKFVMMGGGSFGNVSSTGNTAEFNLWVDPTAAKEVFEKLDVTMIGLDATHASAFSEDDFGEILRITAAGNSKQSNFLHKLSLFSLKNSYENGEDNHIIHDALAIASEIDPSIVTFRCAHVQVVDGTVDNSGQALIDFDSPAPNCRFAADVDQTKFVQLMKKMCKYYAAM